MKDHPCYNKITKQDCPDRKVGCRLTCERWGEYETLRNKEYVVRKACSEAYDIVINSRYTAKLKHKMRQRTK